MIKKDRKTITTNQIARKEFVYGLEDIELKFTLRTDIMFELVIFRQLMERAVKDLGEEITKMDVPRSQP